MLVAMSVHGPLGATDTGAVQLRARAIGARLPALRDRAGAVGLAGLLVTTLLLALAAANTDSLLPESVRPVPHWLAGPFGSTGLDLGNGGLVVVLIAGRRWMPILGVLHHVGRRSGHSYATPLGMRRLGDSFVMPRTFGEEAAWYRNVLAAGGCSVTYLGKEYTLVEPEVIDYATAAPAFPRYERLQFRLIGIDEYLRLRIAPSSPMA